MIRLWLLILLVFGLAAEPSRAQPAGELRMRADLVAQTRTVAPGGLAWIALRQRLEPGWHTYWLNPGDAGGPTEISWAPVPGAEIGPIQWPRPRRLLVQAYMNHVYEGEVLLPIPVQVSPDLRPGDVLRLRATTTAFVCSDTLCVPQTDEVSLDIPVSDETPRLTSHGAAVGAAIEALPTSPALQATHGAQGDRVRLSIAGPAVVEALGQARPRVWFFAEQPGRIDHAAVQDVQSGPQGVTLTLKPGNGPQPDQPLSGLLTIGDRAFQVTARPGEALPGARGRILTPAPLDDTGQGAEGDLGLWKALLFAFLGGVILNLMPCVFPILSMKAAALTALAQDPTAARRDGVAFLAGVMVSFLALAGALIAARAGGQAVGWGFQLQSPAFTGALALVMLAAGLNLAGLYHMGASAPRIGSFGPLRRLGGAGGAFLTGVLAVLLAAPCTGPFMAAAVGFGLTLPAAQALAVFAALGLGFGLPFVAAAFSPGLIRRLPRPGPWMERLRRILAIPMFATALWLAWVFLRQGGWPAAMALLLAAMALAAALVVYGRAQLRLLDSRPARPLLIGAWAGLLAAVILVGVAVQAARGASRPAPAAAFSEAAVAAAQSQGKVVFVNATADWCLTCKVNEAGALAAPAVRRALADPGVVYLEADWTRRDPTIGAYLARHGRSGVPVYLVYGPQASEPVLLPQLLTEDTVLEALRSARPGSSASSR
ncbi:protein-disulfide reductase DsbD family protein [Brevundimonas sp. 2R-24]|uniref:Protein-disulfide reductase DsbD family protein n=1 Tax=Peiella sedimenti TaxID=3061083 RepID=A0ABT8SL08_9CAUL|nr:protein-disulfide reductase DsbD family protein [Caulobacteraceae bacterium XZ-24]